MESALGYIRKLICYFLMESAFHLRNKSKNKNTPEFSGVFQLDDI
ncbi:hypothetical protein BAXH7_00506 [Bacillus amyloliquefaciens XH7]|nr:hypothetical protein BAXH7_00506 [Bacillus amyloliquefaciens XH7]QBG54922.1 hypothetical protein D2M30_0564 [Bacillus amyloliquefaciens]